MAEHLFFYRNQNLSVQLRTLAYTFGKSYFQDSFFTLRPRLERRETIFNEAEEIYKNLGEEIYDCNECPA